jgi:putative sigma-54 modulation protein
MNIKVHATFEVNDYLREVIEDKVGKLATFFDPITAADVYLKLEERRHSVPEAQIAEVRIQVPRQVFFAEDKSDSFERAIAAASDQVRRQLIRYKEQLKSH